MSISSRGPDSGASSTTIAKALVPAETLPVRGAMAWVATMPVPASPSGGAAIAPGRRAPEGSSRAAPVGGQGAGVLPGDQHLGQHVGE